MEYNQDSEKVKTVTEQVQTGPITQTEPIRSHYADPYRTKNQGMPVVSTSEAEAVRTSKADQMNWTSPIIRIIYWFLGVLESFLALRLVLKLLGANAGNSFVNFIYDSSRVFVAPFEGIFEPFVSGFETSTLIAMLVYALVGWGIAKLVAIAGNTR